MLEDAAVSLLIDAGNRDGLRRVAAQGQLPPALRGAAWAALLGVTPAPIVDLAGEAKGEHTERHTVERDVARGLYRYETSKGWSSKTRTKRRRCLERVINATFATNTETLAYYQGFHDVVELLLLVLGFERERLVFAMAQKLLRRSSLRDASRPNGFSSVTLGLQALVPLIYAADAQLAADVFRTDGSTEMLESGIWALSWVLTWFAHDVDDFDTLALIWDHLLATREPCFILYVSVALVVEERSSIIASMRRAEQDDLGVAAMHNHLSRLAGGPVAWRSVLARADSLMRKFPLSRIPRLCARLPRPLRQKFAAVAAEVKRKTIDDSTVAMLRPPSMVDDYNVEQLLEQRRQRNTRHGRRPSTTNIEQEAWQKAPTRWRVFNYSAGALVAGATTAALIAKFLPPQAPSFAFTRK